MKLFSRCLGLICLLALLVLIAWFFNRSACQLKKSLTEPEAPPAPSAQSSPPAITRAAPAPETPAPAEDRLRLLRRSFARTVQVVGVPDRKAPPIEVEGFRIHVGGAEKVRVNRETSDTSAYWIQFSGPIQPAWKTRVERLGGVIHGYVPHHALSVDIDARMAGLLARESFVRAIRPVEPEYKVQPFLAFLTALPGDQAPAEVPVTISVYRPEDISSLGEQLAAMSIPVKAADAGRRWGWLRAEIPRERIHEVAALPRVQWMEEYVAPRLVNDQAVMGAHLNVTNVWTTHGLTGAGQIIGHADTGLDMGDLALLHPDFTGRVVAAFALGRPGLWNDPHGHGTHTAGSILGGGIMSTGQFRGVAWEAGLVHQSILSSGGGLGGLPPNLNGLYKQAYTNGARVHANSWGSSTFGAYTTSCRQSDEFMWDHPDMLLVFAAGNDGWDSGDGVVDPYSMGSPAAAKNVLTVGASESGRPPGSGGYSSAKYGTYWNWDFPVDPIHDDYISRAHDLTRQGMAAFSSRGPTEDERIKPDVVAPGTDVVSTRSRAPGANSGWGSHPNTFYQFNGGTSMSTPLVAGAAALVRQYFQIHRRYETPSAALIKGVLMHGARSLSPGQYGEEAYREIPAATPNEVEGWGQIDLERALFPEGQSWVFFDEKTGLAAPLTYHDHTFYADTGTVRVTLSYTDYPALAGAGQKLVNDLDLVLLGPGGVEATPRRDRTNATEQVNHPIEIAGLYTARVEAINIPQGPQPYALTISGSVMDAPVIEHVPLPNQHATNEPYRVEATVYAAAPLTSNAVSFFWRASATSGFEQVFMTPATGQSYEGWIPAHPRSSEIHYYLVVTAAVYVITDPPAAPEAAYTFEITGPLVLTVSGVPAPIFSVSPSYGTHLIASGNTVRCSAPAFTNQSPGIRLAIAGWSGTGSVPAAGDAHAVDVVMAEDSSIQWEWVTQYALAQTSSVAGIFATTTWWNAWSSGATRVAPSELTHQGQAYGCAGWWLDGLRHPDDTRASMNPVSGIVMFGPRTAEARYLPAAQDENANGLPDWWETFYFGTNGASPGIDSDGDGFTNLKEFQDRTDPRDPASMPQAPAIAHVPLTSPQVVPAPWTLRAVIVDNYAVSNAAVFWQRNGGAWTSAPMSATAATNFTGAIAPPGISGDAVHYRIEATDFAGLTAVSGPYALSVSYPVLVVTPDSFGEINLPAETGDTAWLTISNAGHATLQWSLDRALFYDAIESGTGTWTHAGLKDIWHIQTNRAASGGHAWHYGNGPSGVYSNYADAWLDMPPLRLDAPASLFFAHWARMEYDEDQQDDHYWDGAVVELSIDGGTNYFMIDPVGGYPHRITANPASPFEPETPCYGETEGWETAEFDLSAFAGETVHIRFRFGSDGYVVDEGWYIDDVRVRYNDEASWTWLAIPPDDEVGPQQEVLAAIQLDSAPLAPGDRKAGVLVLTGNDPSQTAPFVIPIGLHNQTREIIVTHSENGNVMPHGTVRLLQGESTNFWIEADTFFVIDQVATNGESATGLTGMDAAWLNWADVQSNSTLHVAFAEKLAAGLVPEWWLFAHGLTNQLPGLEAITDHDDDGMLSWQEYRARTDPNDPESVAVAIIRLDEQGDDRIVIEWLSYTNAAMRYEVHRAADPGQGFAPFTNVPATPPVNQTWREMDSGFEVYRIKAIPDEP